MKDKWDKAQIILQIILGALGAILIPIIIVIVGGTISSQIAQAQMTKDYISMLAQAVSNEDDKALQVILDSLAALKNMEGGIPPTIVAILIRIGKESTNKRIRGSVSLLTSSEDERRLKLYFNP